MLSKSNVTSLWVYSDAEKTEIKYTNIAAYCAVLIDFFSPHSFTPWPLFTHRDEHKTYRVQRIIDTKEPEISYVNS